MNKAINVVLVVVLCCVVFYVLYELFFKGILGVKDKSKIEGEDAENPDVLNPNVKLLSGKELENYIYQMSDYSESCLEMSGASSGNADRVTDDARKHVQIWAAQFKDGVTKDDLKMEWERFIRQNASQLFLISQSEATKCGQFPN